jgi:hypothetical protein
MSESGALAERARYADRAALNGLPFGPHDLVSLGLTITARALDLTDANIQRSFGVTTEQLTADNPSAYELCRARRISPGRGGITCCLSLPPRSMGRRM